MPPWLPQTRQPSFGAILRVCVTSSIPPPLPESQLSSPHHSPHPNGVPSPDNPFFPFPPDQALSHDHSLPQVQAQLPPCTTPPTHHPATSVEALEWYLPQQLTPTHPQSCPLIVRIWHHPMPLTPRLAVDTTHHFLSTHRCSPTSLLSHRSDHSLESTLMTVNGLESQPQSCRLFVMAPCDDTAKCVVNSHNISSSPDTCRFLIPRFPFWKLGSRLCINHTIRYF
jgi:hypothetical protein